MCRNKSKFSQKHLFFTDNKKIADGDFARHPLFVHEKKRGFEVTGQGNHTRTTCFSKNRENVCRAISLCTTFFFRRKNSASFPLVKHFRKFSSSWKQKVGFRGNTGLKECFAFVRKQSFRRSTGPNILEEFAKWAKYIEINTPNTGSDFEVRKHSSNSRITGPITWDRMIVFQWFAKKCVLSFGTLRWT